MQHVVLVLPPQLQTRVHKDKVPQVYVMKDVLRIDVATSNGILKTVFMEILLKSLLLEGMPAFKNYWIPHDLLILLVNQQVDGGDDETVLARLLQIDKSRVALLKEQE